MEENNTLSTFCREDKQVLQVFPCLGDCNNCNWKKNLVNALKDAGWLSPSEVAKLDKSYKIEMGEEAEDRRSLREDRDFWKNRYKESKY